MWLPCLTVSTDIISQTPLIAFIIIIWTKSEFPSPSPCEIESKLHRRHSCHQLAHSSCDPRIVSAFDCYSGIGARTVHRQRDVSGSCFKYRRRGDSTEIPRRGGISSHAYSRNRGLQRGTRQATSKTGEYRQAPLKLVAASTVTSHRYQYGLL